MASYARAVADQMGTTVTAIAINANDVSELGAYGVDKVLNDRNVQPLPLVGLGKERVDRCRVGEFRREAGQVQLDVLINRRCGFDRDVMVARL